MILEIGYFCLSGWICQIAGELLLAMEFGFSSDVLVRVVRVVRALIGMCGWRITSSSGKLWHESNSIMRYSWNLINGGYHNSFTGPSLESSSPSHSSSSPIPSYYASSHSPPVS